MAKSVKEDNEDRLASITGRDGYIVAKALYQACKYQEQLAKDKSTHYEWSDHQDMKAILTEAYPVFAETFRFSDQHCKQEPANLNDEKRVRAGKT